MEGNPELLEPVMSVHVIAPEEFAGNITSIICSKRGRITGMEMQGNARVIKAMVPLACMFGYSTDLRNITQGRGSFTMHFEHYEAVPFAIAEEVIAEKKARAEGK
jgi:elongation factor G